MFSIDLPNVDVVHVALLIGKVQGGVYGPVERRGV